VSHRLLVLLLQRVPGCGEVRVVRHSGQLLYGRVSLVTALSGDELEYGVIE